MEASMKMGEVIYKASQANPNGGDNASGFSEGASGDNKQDTTNNEKVVDAEYEEVKKEDKK